MGNQCPKTVIHQAFHILLVVLGLPLIGASVFYFNYGENFILRILGIILLVFSAFLAWLPVYTLKKKGGVPEGGSFTQTTKLVKSGIYSIVRHPQYLGGMLFGLSFMMISQHSLVLALGIPFMIIFYLAVLDEDKFCLKKFGDNYKEYMKRVPRANLMLGIVKWLFKTN